MSEQYEHMTLVVEGNVVIAVDKPRVPMGSILGQVKSGLLSGLFQPAPGQLVNKTVAYALNQLSAAGWEVTRMPSGTESARMGPTESYESTGIPGLPNILNIPGVTSPQPNLVQGKYHIELKRALRK